MATFLYKLGQLSLRRRHFIALIFIVSRYRAKSASACGDQRRGARDRVRRRTRARRSGPVRRDVCWGKPLQRQAQLRNTGRTNPLASHWLRPRRGVVSA